LSRLLIVCYLIDTSFINLALLYLNSLTVAQYQPHHLTHTTTPPQPQQ
jgi:hypothetical protein